MRNLIFLILLFILGCSPTYVMEPMYEPLKVDKTTRTYDSINWKPFHYSILKSPKSVFIFIYSDDDESKRLLEKVFKDDRIIMYANNHFECTQIKAPDGLDLLMRHKEAPAFLFMAPATDPSSSIRWSTELSGKISVEALEKAMQQFIKTINEKKK